MTIASRLNATIDNHAAAANIIAFALLASVSSISAASISYTGQLTKASYDMPVMSAPAKTKPATKTPTTTVQTGAGTLTATSTPNDVSPLAIQSQIPNAVNALQPAPGANYTTQTVRNLQSSVNNVQTASANPSQHAASL